MSIEYRPVTGVGRFKAKLKGTDLEIKHHLYLVGDLLDQPTTQELNQFQARFQQLIPQHWEGKYRFKRGTQIIQPRFVQKFLPEQDKLRAHYVVNLKSGDGNSAVVARDPYFKFAKGVTGPALDNISRSTNLYVGSTQQPNTATLLSADLKTILPMYVDFSGTQLSVHTRQQVIELSKRLARMNPQPKLYVTAYGTTAAANQATVAQLMKTAGLTNVHDRSSKKAFIPKYWGTTSTSKMSGGAQYVKIHSSREVDTSAMLSNSALYSYPATVVHEFGHMLGLQDEYSCMGAQAAAAMVSMNIIDSSEQQKYENLNRKGVSPPSPNVAAGQEAFIRLCRQADVSVPHFGRHTDSIMSAGKEFMGAHYVFPWDALCQITAQNDWVIEKI